LAAMIALISEKKVWVGGWRDHQLMLR
jgi:hypothetical protein